MDGAVAVALQKKKAKAAAEKQKAAAANAPNRSGVNSLFPTASVGLDRYSVLRSMQRPSVISEHQTSTSELRRNADPYQLDKECLVERLVLEDVMESIFVRCLLFSVLFMFLISMLWMSYPSSSLHPVHESIIDGYDLSGSFSEVKTVEDIQSYLTKAATMSHAFSPSSVNHIQDVQSKSYIHSPRTLPPVIQLKLGDFPTLTSNFTLTVWVKTKVQLDTIIRKVANGLTCWSLGPEAVIFGEHDSFTSEIVVNPWAKSIYKPGVMRADAWKVSEIRRKVSDDKWHNLGFRVNASHIDFVYDGEVIQGESPLYRPMTDCPGGIVTIGSKHFVVEMTDLVFFNRYLRDEELRDTFVAGRPISVMLSGSGPMASEHEFTVQEQLAEMDTSTGHRFRELKDNVQVGQRNAVLELLKRHGTTSSIATAPSSGTALSGGAVNTDKVDNSRLPTEYDNIQSCVRRDGTEYIEPPDCSTNITRYAVAVLVKAQAISSRIKPEALKTIKEGLRNGGTPISDDKLRSLDILLDACVTHVRYCIHENKILFADLKPGEIMSMTETLFKEKVETCRARFVGDFDFCRDYVSSTFLDYLRSSVLLVQQQNCRVRKAYRDKCLVTCGLPCDASPIPEDPIVPNHELEQCADSDTYRDSWDRHCAWYQLNDNNCERYATDETKEHCRLTCNSCTLKRAELKEPVLETPPPEPILNVEELNALLLRTNREDMLISRNMAHSYVAYYCCLEKESRGESADDKWRTILGESLSCDLIKPSPYNAYSGQYIDLGLRPALRSAFMSDYPNCFPSGGTNNALAMIGFPKKWFVESDARNIIARIFIEGAKYGRPNEEPRLVIFSGRPGGTRTLQNNVQLFTRDSMRGNEWSLTVDNPEWRWQTCNKDLDCITVAFACRPDHYSRICKTLQATGFPPQKQFCSPVCWTGGCNRTLLEAGGKVCQPCDACVGETCSETCDGKAGIRTDFDATSYQMKLDEYKRNVTKWNTHEARDNTFSISAWVKDFHFQRILEKRVNVTLPPAHRDSEGYDKSTNTLTCYSLSYSEFCFRTHWYDKKMMCIPNPLLGMLQDDKWHHVAVVKSALEKTPNGQSKLEMKRRVDDFKFFVDGKESASTKHESIIGQISSLTPYAVSDCGGPMVSTMEITHAHDDAALGKDSTAFAHQLQHLTRTEFSHLLPLGGNSTMVLRFLGLDVPKHAVIKEAYLELSAVQNPAQQAIESVMCGTRMGNNSSTEPIHLQIFSPQVDVLHHPCGAFHDESACIEKGCHWGKGQCTGGFFGGSCSPWNGANAMLGSDATRPTVVGWDVETNNWRKTNLRAATILENHNSFAHGAFESTAYDTATESGSVRISPDVSAIVKDILARDSYDPKNTVATFVLQGPDASSNTCESEIDSMLDAGSDGDGEKDTCAGLQHLSDFIDREFPLFALSKDGAGKVESGSAPRLRVYWCHTEDCISPTFAGAGDDVKWGRQGFTVPPSHPDLGPPPRAEDPKISAPATPIYNDIPYMVFGVSTTDDQDPVAEGKMFDLRTMPKAMTLGEVQKTYYANIKSVPNLPGPERTIDAQSEQSQLDVSAYSKEVFSIAPPILLQRRNLGVACGKLVPALGSAMTQYFNMQIDKQCMNGPYTCNFPNKGHNNTHNVNGESGFSCVDRNQYLTLDQYFGRKSVTFKQKHFFFPEFLEVMNLRTVYRNDKMLATRSWVDLESSTIVLISVFLAVNDRIGTVMQLKFENRGAGHVKASYFLSSFKQMPPSEQTLWIILACAVWICCFIEMGLIISSVIVRLREKKQWQILAMNNSKKRTEEMVETYPTLDAHELELILQEESQRLQRRMKLIANNTLIIDFWDVFDVVLRLIIFSSAVACVVTSFSAALHSSDPLERLGYMEGYMKDILLLPWHSESIQYAKKVQNFVDLIANIVIQVEYLREMRVFNAVLILLCLFRLIVYMRVHPKVAILYKTIAASVDDLFHFALTFSFLYFVLAFVATWTFGAIDKRFATFGASCYEQFNMIIGEFPMDPVAELQGLYIAYLFVFCVLMFLTVMNFFLAIIIDSYSAIKDQVNECTVSKNFTIDLYHTFAFYYYRWKENWPSRKELIKLILRADMDKNHINDQEQSFAVSVKPQSLVENYILPDLDSATAFVTYYLNISRDISGSKKHDKNNESILEHHLVLKRLLQLDLVSQDRHGLHREVHPLGRRSDETKSLVKQLVRTGQKILTALRINKTQFARDQLLQDDDVADDMTAGKRTMKGLEYSTNLQTVNSFVIPRSSMASMTSMASNQPREST